MRSLVALLVVGAFLALPTVNADWQDLPLDVIAYRMADGHTLLAWSPQVHADHYDVYRGASPGHLAKVHTGTTPGYYDADVLPAGTVIYVIAAVAPDGSTRTTAVTTDSEGACVEMSDTLNFSITLGDCLSQIPEL